MTVYSGNQKQTKDGGMVVKRGTRILSPKPSQELFNHSPDGFSWGYGGSGPAQLALALLFDVTLDKEIALTWHQDFKRDVVVNFGGEWKLTEDKIWAWLKSKGVARG